MQRWGERRRAIERLNGPAESGTRQRRRFEDRENRLSDGWSRARAADCSALQRKTQIGLRGFVDLEDVDLNVDLAVIDRVQPIDKLAVAGEVRPGQAASAIENRLSRNRIGRVTAYDDVALAVRIDPNVGGARNVRDSVLQAGEILRDRHGIDDHRTLRFCDRIKARDDVVDLLELRAVAHAAADDDRVVEADDLNVGLRNRAAQHLREIVELLGRDRYLIGYTLAAGPDENRRMARGLAVHNNLRGS